jgi:hypothetical protein
VRIIMPLVTDRDLLIVEPSAFVDAASAATVLLSAADGGVSSETLTSASSNFATLGIDSAHVIVVAGQPLEIVQRLSATQLEVSRPRAASADAKIAPGNGSNQAFSVPTFARLIAQTQFDLLQALGARPDDPSLPLAEDDVLNPEPLSRLIALRALERVFALASAHDPDDASLAGRSAVLAAQAADLAASTVILLDLDGDGEADATRRVRVAAWLRA